MSRKGKSITLSLEGYEKQALEELARKYDMMWGDRPNISKLLKAIASKKLLVAANHDWSRERIQTLDNIRKILIDTGEQESAKLIARIIRDRSETNDPMRVKIENFLTEELPNWRKKIDDFILRQQPFKLIYQDAQERVFQFTVLHAKVIPIEKGLYLVCRCEETESNTDVEELQHNWTLRLDRIQAAEAISIDRRWEQDLQKILVQFYLYKGLISSYESKSGDIDPEKLNVDLESKSDRPHKTIVREVYSTFWFFREIIRYGVECEIVYPENVRSKFVREKISQLSKLYNI